MANDLRSCELRGLVSYYLTKHNYSKSQLALKIGISPATLYRKLDNPKTFTFGEFLKLMEILNLTPEQKLKVV
jgi:DNA-binding phage protein